MGQGRKFESPIHQPGVIAVPDLLDMPLESLATEMDSLMESPYSLGEARSYSTPRITESGLIDRSRVIPGCVVRELSVADVIALREAGPTGASKGIRNLRDSHHRVARLFARGVDLAEISLSTGFSPARLKDFQHDQTMQELVVFYAKAIEDVTVDLHEKYKATVGDAHAELQELQKAAKAFLHSKPSPTEGAAQRSGSGGSFHSYILYIPHSIL